MILPSVDTYTCGSSPNALESRSCLLSSRLKIGLGTCQCPRLTRGFVPDGRVHKECGDFQGRILSKALSLANRRRLCLFASGRRFDRIWSKINRKHLRADPLRRSNCIELPKCLGTRMLARPATSSDDIFGGRRGFKVAGVQLRPVRQPTDGSQTPSKGSELRAAVPQFRPLLEARHNNIRRRQEEAIQSIRSESCSYELVRHVRDQNERLDAYLAPPSDEPALIHLTSDRIALVERYGLQFQLAMDTAVAQWSWRNRCGCARRGLVLTDRDHAPLKLPMPKLSH